MKLNEKTGLYTNYEAWHIPFWQTPKFKMTAQICLFLLIICIMALLLKKYRAYRAQKKLPIWDQVLAELAALKKQNKLTVHYGKEFYVMISNVLKKYLSERFHYKLIGTTDNETIEYLKKENFNSGLINDIETLLQGGEIIKFANAQAAQEQIESDYARAIAIVERTIPKNN